jgi:hypothetical protein
MADIIKMYIREIGSADVKATKLAQEPVKWHT